MNDPLILVLDLSKVNVFPIILAPLLIAKIEVIMQSNDPITIIRRFIKIFR